MQTFVRLSVWQSEDLTVLTVELSGKKEGGGGWGGEDVDNLTKEAWLYFLQSTVIHPGKIPLINLYCNKCRR